MQGENGQNRFAFISICGKITIFATQICIVIVSLQIVLKVSSITTMFKKEKLSFTGHDSFYCRSYWLKKGYDFVQKGGKFNDNAVIELGVGRNMVNAIRYWSRAFGLIDENDVAQPIAKAIFDTKGFDPYCEDKATLWLLHYLLVTTRRASLYSIVFNTFRKEWIEFNKDYRNKIAEKIPCPLLDQISSHLKSTKS